MRLFATILMALGWFAVVTQLVIMFGNSTAGGLLTVVRFFSYFTILTNTLVAVCFTSLVLFPRSVFFRRPPVITALTVYITIVGIVYNLLLRQIWDPQGLQKVVDELLHTLIPILCIVYFILFVPNERLPWRSAFGWLIYPLVYSVYIVIRGSIVNEYPYPFIDIGVLGYTHALINCFFILAGFLVVSLVFIGIGRLKRSRPPLEP